MNNFDIFWAAFPKRKNKPDARKAWGQLKLEKDEETVNKIIQAIKSFKAHKDWQRDGGQFIPYPASFIRGERWEDEMDVDLGEEAPRW